TVDFQHLHAHFIAFLELVGHVLDALIGDLRDVHQAIAARQNRHEGAEIHQTRDAAFIDTAHFHVGGDQFDAAQRLATRGTLHGGDLHGAIILDVDGGARLFGDLTDHCTTLADDIADLLRVDLDGDDRRRPLAHLRARRRDHLVHLAEDVQAAFMGLVQRHLHDFRRDAVDLDVHLQRGDARGGTGYLEIHVAEMIFIAKDVGDDLETATFKHHAHGHTRHRRLDGYARIHQREAGAADRGHRARTIGFENFRHHANDVGELFHLRQHGADAATGQIAVADFAALGRTHHAGLAHRERREVVMQHEGLATLTFQRVDDLSIAARAQRHGDQRLRLAAREQCGTMRARQRAGLHDDGTHGLEIAAVDARLAIQDALAHDLALEIVDLRADVLRAPLCNAIDSRHGRSHCRLDLAHLGVAILLHGDAIGFGEL